MREYSVYKILEKERNKKIINDNEEINYYSKHKALLKDNPLFNEYLEAQTPFEIIKANIIIRGIKNKYDIDEILVELSQKENKEEFLNIYKEKLLDLPSISYENYKIYFPFFNRLTNIVYNNELDKLNKAPYNILFNDYSSFLVSPFDSYGVDLFDSTFTKLVKIDEDLTSVAFYSYHLNCLLIINRQGSLDSAIYLFDKHLKHPNKSHILDRVKDLATCYYSNNIHDFVYSLYKNEFISYKVFKKICKAKKI